MVESAKSNQHAPMRSEARRLIPQQRPASDRVGDAGARANHANSGYTRLLIAQLMHLSNSGYPRRTRVGGCYSGWAIGAAPRPQPAMEGVQFGGPQFNFRLFLR